MKERDQDYENLLIEGFYWCVDCEEPMPIENFYLRGTGTSAGKPVSPYCKRHYNHKMVRRRKAWKYGVDYDELMEQQDGVCLICKQEPKPMTSLCVDHDHLCCPEKQKSCGKCVRGLLCNRCNVGIAMFQDNPILLMEAARYVERSRKS